MRLRLAENFRAVFYAPLYATVALGFAAREGLEIELVASPGPGGGPAAVLEGRADVTWGGPMRIMKARNDPDGPPFVLFTEVVRRDPFYLVARPGIDRFALADLAHLRLGSVSEVPTPWLCLQQDLRDLGIDPAGIERVADQPMPDNIAALSARALDIAQVFEPYAAAAERRRLGRVVHAQASRGDTSYTTLCATREGARRHRAAFAALDRAVGRMQEWLAANPADDLAAAVAPWFADVDAADLATALARYRANSIWAGDTGISRAGFDRLAQSLQSGGFIRSVPAYEDCVIDPATA
jgi:NitT/TauT family transport system substrate-binding protein